MALRAATSQSRAVSLAVRTLLPSGRDPLHLARLQANRMISPASR
jgi:hypothetical protein